MKKIIIISALLLLSVSYAMACNFYFEVESQEINSGEEFYVRVIVQKTHNRCTLDDMETDYKFVSDNMEIIGKTAWKEIQSNVYESWLKVEAGQTGEAFIKIWKDCPKEGYEEKLISFKVI